MDRHSSRDQAISKQIKLIFSTGAAIFGLSDQSAAGSTGAALFDISAPTAAQPGHGEMTGWDDEFDSKFQVLFY